MGLKLNMNKIIFSQMKKERTLVMVKPDGVKRKLVGECIRRFENEGFEIIDIKIGRLSTRQAEDLRKDIKINHPIIYNDLIEYMTEGEVCAMILSGNGVVSRARELIGATNPKEAKKGTIRGDFGSGDDMRILYKQGRATKNIIHSSGSLAEAEEEIRIIFN